MRLPVLACVLLLAPFAAAAPLALPCGAPLGLGDCAIPNASLEACDGCASDTGALPDGWLAYEFPGQCFGDGVSWTTEASHTGNASVRIEDLADRCTGLVSPAIVTTPGLPYRATLWARAAEGSAPQMGIFIVYYATADADVQDYIIKTPYATTLGTTWREVYVQDIAVPAGTAVRLWAYSPMGATGTYFVDDFSLRVDPDAIAAFIGLP